MDEAGWDADLLLGSLRQTRPRLAYLIPEFQNPTGHLMPAPLREQLVATAQRAGTDLVIDESFVDLPLDGQPMPPAVAGFDRHGRVLTIGGMSKPFWGGLRIGWVRASAPTVQRLAAARVGVDTAGPVLDQLVGVHLLSMADKVIADRRRQLANARDALLAAVGEHLPAWRITRPSGGVTLWAELDGPVSSALARAVESMGVRVAPGPRFGVDGTLERFLRLPFTQPIPELVDGIRRIAAARYDLDRTGSRPQWSEPELIA
jgi:DNA-binding transcriptional MocR family regulator